MRRHRFHATLLAPFPAAWLAALLALGATVAPAWASVESDCAVDVRVRHADFSRCNTMTAMGPGNDTRANLLMLLLDRDMPPPDFLPAAPKPLPEEALPVLSWKDIRNRYFPAPPPPDGDEAGFAAGEGSRCRSNLRGAAAFARAVDAARLSPQEHDWLVGARTRLAPTCKDARATTRIAADDIDADAAAPGAHSPKARDFATYLRGTGDFYAGDFTGAATAFSRLHGTTDAWLADTADYMVARTQVNRLQVGAFDDYGEFEGSDHVDQAAATQAATYLEAYLRDHANGAYVASARGLLRRVYWLSGRNEALAAAYVALIARPASERGIDDATLAEEIDSKLLAGLKPEALRDPILLAVLDLKAMREQDSDAGADTRHVDLEAQRPVFAGTPLLFDYLAATQALYVDDDPAKVLKLVPDDTRRRGGDHLWFSRQVLRGLALEAEGDRNARGFWKELAPGASRPLDRLTVELALAMHDERAGTLDDVFAPGSVVASPKLRDILLANSADASLLRREAENADRPAGERQVALATLLWKEVTRGRPGDFVADVALVPTEAPTDSPTEAPYDAPPPSGLFTRPAPGDIDCPLLRATAEQLAEDPRAPRARLCLAEFVRVAGLDQAFLDTRPAAANLGGAPSQFPGKAYARTDTYMAIIADKSAPAADRAFALYRAVKCYEPANNNGCGGESVPKAKRKAWYFALKHDYPTSRWAKELPYWW